MIFEKKYKENDNIIIKKDIIMGKNIVISKNEKGKIMFVTKTIYDNNIYGIRFERKNKYRHDLQGKCKKGMGFLVMPQYFKLNKD